MKKIYTYIYIYITINKRKKRSGRSVLPGASSKPIPPVFMSSTKVGWSGRQSRPGEPSSQSGLKTREQTVTSSGRDRVCYVPETRAHEVPATAQRQHVTGADVDLRGHQTSRLPLAATVDRHGFRPRAAVRANPVNVVRAVAARRDAMVFPHVRIDAVQSRIVCQRHGVQLRRTRLRGYKRTFEISNNNDNAAHEFSCDVTGLRYPSLLLLLLLLLLFNSLIKMLKILTLNSRLLITKIAHVKTIFISVQNVLLDNKCIHYTYTNISDSAVRKSLRTFWRTREGKEPNHTFRTYCSTTVQYSTYIYIYRNIYSHQMNVCRIYRGKRNVYCVRCVEHHTSPLEYRRVVIAHIFQFENDVEFPIENDDIVACRSRTRFARVHCGYYWRRFFIFDYFKVDNSFFPMESSYGNTHPSQFNLVNKRFRFFAYCRITKLTTIMF